MRHVDLLQGFQMVASLTQDTVNYQFSQLFKRQVIHPKLDIVLADTGIELHAELSAPTVSFSVPDTNRTVLFKLNMPSGTFVYWEGFGAKAKQIRVSFKDWTYAFRVNLDMKRISQDHIKAGSAVPSVVKEHLDKFSDAFFSIKHLFLDLENADFASFDMNHTRMKFPNGSQLTPGQITQFQQAISNYFNSLKGTNNPYILGYSIEDNQNHPDSHTATFAPTSNTFSTFDDPTSEGMNVLNFLMMANNAPLPNDPRAGVFPTNWVTSQDYSGKFVISSGLFWDRWLLQKINDGLQAGNPSITETGWSFDKNTENKYTRENFNTCISDLTKVNAYITQTDHRTANVTYKNVNASQVTIDLKGTFSKSYKNEFTCVFYEWVSETATIDWTGKLTISAGDGQLPLHVELNVPEATKSTDGNWIGKGDIALIPSNQTNLDQIGSSFNESMKGSINMFKKFLSDLSNRFILPAGDVFYFKNPQMDDAGNLLLDITYKSEH
ncbi:hypothetical protein J2T13_002766 [Paenibacillus sp. DS2015]|uniref:hypothetical protein n=1 Tax=Paenibacillus sp. DS2015 TaxID=3373917 RepID=UPI003D1D2B7C